MGTVTEVDEENCMVQVVGDMATCRVPAQSIEIRPYSKCQPVAYQNFTRSGKLKKQSYLISYGFWNAEESYPIEPVTQKTPALLADQHIKLFRVVLQATFKNLSFDIIEPGLLLRQLFGENADPDPVRKEELSEILRECQVTNELLLLPIHCEESVDHLEGHWTLLAVRRVQGDIQVRYYDGMNEPNEICLSKALNVLAMLGLPQASQELTPCNVFRQPGSECTEVLLHYAAMEVRDLAGEGRGSVGVYAKHKIKVRSILNSYSVTLEKARLEWLEEWKMDEIKKKQVQKALAVKFGSDRQIQVQLQRLLFLVEQISALQAKHSDLPDFILPPMFKEVKVKTPSEPASSAQPPEPSMVEEIGEPQDAPAVVELRQEIIAAQNDQNADPLEKETTAAEAKLNAEASGAVPIDLDEVAPQAAPQDDVSEEELQKKKDLLASGEETFEKWVRSLSQPMRLAMMNEVSDANPMRAGAIAEYITQVRMKESPQGCGKCRGKKCEKCNYVKAQNYVIRNANTPYWFNKLERSWMRLAISVIYIYIYIYIHIYIYIYIYIYV
jgi:hypothetical protein